MSPRIALAAAALVALVACSDSGSSADAPPPAAPPGPLVVDDGCQPLLAGAAKDEISPQGTCLLPYPSDFYLTGGRVTLPPAAKPKKKDGTPADPHDVVVQDGASMIPTIVATLPGKIERDGLPGVLDDPGPSMQASSPTILMRADDGSFVPHYVDVPDRAPVEEERKPIVIRPIRPLEPKTRYVVALRGVALEGGGRAAPAEGFRRLRDKETGDRALDALGARYDADVFGPLEKAGVPRGELQLAWDFTTGSAERPIADLVRIRERTLAWLAANTPAVKIVSSTPGNDTIFRIVKGTVQGPLFLTEAKPGALLVRDDQGLPEENGTTQIPFEVVIPKSVHDTGVAGRALAYGHGFFGGTDELEGAGGKAIGNTIGAVLFGVEWWGMSKPDLGTVASTLTEHPEHVADFAERVEQAMANWMVLTAAIRGPMKDVAELMDAGKLVYDPSHVYYFGASQGHILGGTMVALDPDIARAVLNVGGGGFTHIMPRSANFGPFALLIGGAFDEALVTQTFVAMFQPLLDRIDPISFAPLVSARPLPGSPTDRRVLLQTGLGDPAVPNLASFLHARALGAKQTVPAPAKIPLLETTPGNEPITTITLFDYGIDTSGYAEPLPLPPNKVHDTLRTNPAAMRQMDAFLKPDGVSIQPCDGPCDPE